MCSSQISRLFAASTFIAAGTLVACAGSSDPIDGPVDSDRGSAPDTKNDTAGANAGTTPAFDSTAAPATAPATADAGSAPSDVEGQACPAAGQTQRCYVGDPAEAGIGSCTWGTQTCGGAGEFPHWGPCTGSGAPAPGKTCRDTSQAAPPPPPPAKPQPVCEPSATGHCELCGVNPDGSPYYLFVSNGYHLAPPETPGANCPGYQVKN